ncbi:MAG: hypothetical protein IJ113_08940 [Eggerthellaceae bacterium]|nr:hypothetical protein [Eggerthellaceae bacterium]
MIPIGPQRTSLLRLVDAWRKRRFAKRYANWSALSEADLPEALAQWYQKATGRALDLDNPQTYDEKIQWIKLYGASPEMGRLSDKYLVREWVAERAGEDVLVPLLGVWDSSDKIDFDALPDQFVLKATHGCGWNIVVHNKQSLVLSRVRQQLAEWLSLNYAYMAGLEMQYRYCEPRIIAEAYLENEPGDLYDYKFFCFKGRAECIGFVRGRAAHPSEACFDRAWNKLPCTYYTHPRIEEEIPKPAGFDRALEIAESLAKGFEHVRVDLYILPDATVHFGEMTFTTLSGNARWNPPEYNDYYGSLIDLSNFPAWHAMHPGQDCSSAPDAQQSSLQEPTV